MKKKKLLQLLSGALTAAILISGNGVAVAAQELNGTAGEYAQAEQTEEDGRDGTDRGDDGTIGRDKTVRRDFRAVGGDRSG